MNVEHRTATLADVNYPKRMIELIAMPYETPTTIHDLGRSYEEVVSRNAFAGVEERNGRVRVNRAHKLEEVIGRAERLHSSRQEGLVAEIRISRTDEGERALVQADEGLLDASAGFMLLADRDGKVYPDAEVWETRNRRRLNRLWLHHIALTADAAYETARVLAVRQRADHDLTAAVLGPNREQLRQQELLRLEADLDARYGLSR